MAVLAMRVETPASRLHALAGAPPQTGCTDTPDYCVICASPARRTALFNDWPGSGSTDQNKLRGLGLSERLCEPCVWAHSWVSPPGWKPTEQGDAKKAAKRAALEAELAARGAVARGARDPNLRLFSHFWCESTGYVFLNKGDKPQIREWLRARRDGESWWAAIADSGQKHTLPWVREQKRARGVVRFEDRDVAVGDWTTLDVMSAALTAGVTKAEIEEGNYGPRAWELAESHVRTLRALAERELGSGWWSLCVWLAQRNEAEVAARIEQEKAAKAAKKEAVKRGRSAKAGVCEGSRGGARARDASGVPESGSKRARPLEPSTRPAAGRGANERDGRADDHGDAPRPAPRGAQLGLFG